jgi:hypothetical protein
LLLLRCAGGFAARVGSLMQPSPSAEVHIGLSDVEDKHTIVFLEKEHVVTEILPPMTVLSPHEDKQRIVLETETITPVCLFPAPVMPVVAPTQDGCQLLFDPNSCGLHGNEDNSLAHGEITMDSDAFDHGEKMLRDGASPAAEESSFGFGEEVLLGSDTALSDPSIHLPPYYKKHSSDNALLVSNTAQPPFSIHATRDYGSSQPTLASLLPFNYGESQLTVDYGECLPAIKVHSKELDNDGEITTKIISTIVTDDPITNTWIDHTCSSVISPCGNRPRHSIQASNNTDPPEFNDTDATLLHTFKHGDSFED